MSAFRLLRELDPRCLGYTGYIDERSARWFVGDSLAARFARALGARRAVAMKEVVESFEFFAAVRKDARAADLVDLCAGHGLVGALFALHERRVEAVHLVDRNPPASRAAVLAAAAEVGPWTAAKFTLHDRQLKRAAPDLPLGAAVVAVHACGERTDRAIDIGLALGGPIAVMPCCHSKRRCPSSPALARELGHELAIDVDRTYRMEAAGYNVRWTDVAEEITPKNRILVGRRRSHRSLSES